MKSIKFILALLCLMCMQNPANSAQVKIITATDLATKLEQQDNAKKVLLFFTSWCSYCKGTINNILAMPDEQRNKVFFISLDKNQAQVVSFATKLSEDVTIYHIASINEIIAFFEKFGIEYKGSVPYISVLDEDNKLLKDDINERQIRKFLK